MLDNKNSHAFLNSHKQKKKKTEKHSTTVCCSKILKIFRKLGSFLIKWNKSAQKWNI